MCMSAFSVTVGGDLTQGLTWFFVELGGYCLKLTLYARKVLYKEKCLQ